MNRRVIAIVTFVALLGITGWGIRKLHGDPDDEEEEQPKQPPSAARTVTENGETAIIISPAIQKENGIRIAPLAAGVRRQRVQANALVLPAQGLLDERERYEPALAQVQKARAALEVSRQEYERLQSLLPDNNVSLKQVQAAEGVWRGDSADYNTAQRSLALEEARARQNWGPVLAQWIFEDSPEFEQVARMEGLLVQVSLPTGAKPEAPPAANLELQDGRIANASLISRFPRVDPRIQGASFLYLTQSQPDLLPGMTLAALLPAGPPERGVFVPADAVVWWEGIAWTYVRTAPDRFVREAVSTGTPLPGGFLVERNLHPGEQIVVKGGQQLLSQEFRSSIQKPGD